MTRTRYIDTNMKDMACSDCGTLVRVAGDTVSVVCPMCEQKRLKAHNRKGIKPLKGQKIPRTSHKLFSEHMKTVKHVQK